MGWRGPPGVEGPGEGVEESRLDAGLESRPMASDISFGNSTSTLFFDDRRLRRPVGKIGSTASDDVATFRSKEFDGRLTRCRGGDPERGNGFSNPVRSASLSPSRICGEGLPLAEYWNAFMKSSGHFPLPKRMGGDLSRNGNRGGGAGGGVRCLTDPSSVSSATRDRSTIPNPSLTFLSRLRGDSSLALPFGMSALADRERYGMLPALVALRSAANALASVRVSEGTSVPRDVASVVTVRMVPKRVCIDERGSKRLEYAFVMSVAWEELAMEERAPDR